MVHYAAEIFDEEPERWGLRGDPDFWQYLKVYYAAVELPYSVEELKETILEQFKSLTGSFPSEGAVFSAEQFAAVHKGVSTGMLSGTFWLETAIPLLSKRLKIANEECSCRKRT